MRGDRQSSLCGTCSTVAPCEWSAGINLPAGINQDLAASPSVPPLIPAVTARTPTAEMQCSFTASANATSRPLPSQAALPDLRAKTSLFHILRPNIGFSEKCNRENSQTNRVFSTQKVNNQGRSHLQYAKLKLCLCKVDFSHSLSPCFGTQS